MQNFDDLSAEFAFATQAIRAGHRRTAENEHNEPIFTTSSFVFSSAAEAAARFAEETGEHNIYSRFTNPTVRTFEQRLACLEGGEAAVATASGMAAILATCLAFLSQGDEVICSRSVFGSTASLFSKFVSKWGIQTHFVDLQDLSAWQAAMTPRTRLLFVETPSNPLCELANLQALSQLARAHACKLVVDNCFCTPALQRPLSLGADIVVHSATKYLDGQGRALGGAVVGNAQDMAQVFNVVRTCGPCMSPFNAWVFLKGLETLELRMRAHSANALALATWLSEQPKVEKVHYAGLASHPQHALAKAQMHGGFGGVLSFVVRGGREAAWSVIDQTQMLSITGNLGDVKTTITHPATTTHGKLTPEQRAQVGIEDGLIRIAVGLEALADIQADLAVSL
ncbi:O-succinylhomoserine sulfhydrylase [Allopseudospirillum japonicum]|uniref:O-succinylhomoserine sulfhydrylase n=1 Tax=Allopseudospirillum japonicum TaxID=64971 RepID=A0A1H6RFH5_9GAMM|nr:O-succinylhomoserine sulfhydrylase [Allopseudospirillum japonicum]SEI54493.1 O-succinylhomoserine sulfhydrylase [Allopseudospirillum japonicum]